MWRSRGAEIPGGKQPGGWEEQGCRQQECKGAGAVTRSACELREPAAAPCYGVL